MKLVNLKQSKKKFCTTNCVYLQPVHGQSLPLHKNSSRISGRNARE